MTFIIIFLWVLWSGVWVADLVGYVQEAEWYFQDSWQRQLLRFGWIVTSIPLAMLFVQWWYLLAKPPQTERGFDDFWRTFQSPDRRTLRYFLPAGIYVVAYGLAMAGTMALATDDVQAAMMYLFLIAAPPFFMASSVRVYGLPREQEKL